MGRPNGVALTDMLADAAGDETRGAGLEGTGGGAGVAARGWGAGPLEEEEGGAGRTTPGGGLLGENGVVGVGGRESGGRGRSAADAWD
jgi:hypothetical protein